MNRVLLLIVTLSFCTRLHAAHGIVLDPLNHISDWSFDNGQEFPGATGHLAKHRKAPALMLSYDFTKGGAYVQAKRKGDLPEGASRITFQAQSEADSRIRVRVITVDKRCFQSHSITLRATVATPVIIDLKTPFPEAWGGVGEGKVPSGTITAIALVVSGTGSSTVGIGDLRVIVHK